MEIDEDLGGVRFSGSGVAWTERSYPRPKGAKVVSRIPSLNSSARFDRDDAIKRNFNLLLAVDTNYRNIGGDVIAATAVLGAKFILIGHPQEAPQIGYSYFPLPFAIFRSPAIPPEKLGWDFAIQSVSNARLGNRFSSIGLIVDAHLSEINEINSRKRAVVGERYLPEGMSLIYASAERGQDDLANKLMHHADMSANILLKEFENRNGTIPLKSSDAYASAGYTRVIGTNTIRPEEI